jgi:nucleoside-diphosphate-sugar epimerase
VSAGRSRIALVTGAAGVMGRRLCERLRTRGWAVRGLVLPGEPGQAELGRLGVEVREGDIRDPASLRGICDGVDTVFHLAAIIVSNDVSVFARVNRDGTSNIVAEACAARVGHVIYVSSASVTYPKRTPYAESKLAAEHFVKECGRPYTIARPTLVYDAGGGQELLMFLAYLERFPVVPFIGAGGARKRPVWAEDVVDGLLRIAENPVSHGKTYNLSGAESITMLELSRLLLRQRGRLRPFVHLPVSVCRFVARVLAACMARPPVTPSAVAGVVNDADLDPVLAVQELGYHPLGVREGLPLYFTRERPLPSSRPLPKMSEPSLLEGVSR